MRPGAEILAGVGVGFVETDVLGFDRESAALRHRVASVYRQVQQNLFNLPGVGAYGP